MLEPMTTNKRMTILNEMASWLFVTSIVLPMNYNSDFPPHIKMLFSQNDRFVIQ